ncbi:MAG: aspartate 1-decarboxylase [Actinobacteria bacterium]|nr:aspartate 1-decarboxylase [Actinomycetota bacterium]
MLVSILKSKIHRALVTDAKIHYMGSITIDKKLMEKARLLPYEKVLVVSLDSGERLETYVLEGREGEGEVCLNGAAARKILKGDRIIIMSFAFLEEEEARKYKPAIVYLDDKNQVIKVENHLDQNDQC